MQYNYEKTIGLYNEVVKRYAMEVTPTEKERKMLEGLLESKNTGTLSKWVDSYPKSDNPKPSGVEILHARLKSLTPTELEDFTGRLVAEEEAYEIQHEELDEPLGSDVQKMYSSIISNSITNNSSLHPSEKAVYRQLENVVSVADLQKWASEVRYGGNLYYSEATPYSVQEDVRKLAQQIYDANDDNLTFILNDIYKTRYSDSLNHIRMGSLREKYDTLKMRYPSEIILFKNPEGFTIIGDDALRVMNATGWPAGMVKDTVSGETMMMLNINKDGYETLVNKDMNFRTTLPLGYVNTLTNQWFNNTNYALQTIDYNLSQTEKVNVNIPTENLSIGDFKAKSLSISDTRMDAISESGESMVIRDIPDNFYHFEGTLVVADYINGNRNTIESMIATAKKSPVESNETFLDQRARENESGYIKAKTSNPGNIVAIEDNNIYFSYGKDAETIARNTSAALHKTPSGITYVTASREDIESLIDNPENKGLRLVASNRDVEGNAMTVSSESIKIDENKPGTSAMVHKNADGTYGVTEMNTAGIINGPKVLSEDECREYDRLRNEGTIEDRKDFVIRMADKYYHQEICQENTVKRQPQEQPAVQEEANAADKPYYVSVSYLQFEEDTRLFDKLSEEGKYGEMLTLASEYDNGDSFEQSDVWDSPHQNRGDQIIDENKYYAIVYNATVGGTYDLLRKVTEQDIRDHINRYGLERDAADAVKKIANAMVKEQFENIKNTPAFTMGNGSVLHFQYNEDTNKVEVGTVTNAGLAPHHEFDYDHGFTLDQNLESVYEQLSEMPEYQKEEENEEQDIDNELEPEKVSIETREDLRKYTLPEQDVDMVHESTPLEGYEKYWNYVSAKVIALDLTGYKVPVPTIDLAVKHLKGEKLTEEERDTIEKTNESYAAAIEKDGKRNYVDFTAREIIKEAGSDFRKPEPKEAPVPEYIKTEEPSSTVNPAELKGMAYHAYLLGKSLSEASANDGVWLNSHHMSAPTFALSNDAVPAYNQLVMSLHSSEKNYATNVYLSFDDAKSMDLYLRKGEKAIGLVNYSSRQYVNSFRAAEVITQDEYDKLPKEEKSIFRPASRQRGTKELASIFNIDQTTAPEVIPEKYKEMVAAAHREETTDKKDPAKLLETYKALLSENPDDTIFVNAGNFYETYDDTAEKVSGIIGVPAVTDESRDCKVLSFPVSKSPEIVAALNSAKLKVSLYDSSTIRNRPMIDYRKEAMDFVTKAACSMGICVDKITYMPTAYDKKEDSIHIKTDNLSTETEKSPDIKDINDMYRAIADATDKSERLDRSARLDLKPEDAKKYNALITELTSGVLMLRQGLPARISEENMQLIPYWQRELRENPKIMEVIERNVDSAYKAIIRHHDGKEVNYADIRDTKQTEHMQPKFYSIVNELAKQPNAETRHAVIIRDKDTSTATVILPAGASTDSANEIPGMNKNRFRVALGKEGYENISFYNADGYLSLNQPNNFFIGKEVSVEKLRQYKLEKFIDIDLSKEIHRTEKPEIKSMRYLVNDEGKCEFYIKPADGKPISILPMPEDLSDYFESYKMENKEAGNDKRRELAQKYLEIAKKYPEALTDTLSPKLPEGVDVARIEKVNVTKDKNSDKYLVFMQTDGKWHRHEITNEQYKRMFLADNAHDYKIALAGKLFAQELGHTRSVGDTQQVSQQKAETKDESDGIHRQSSKNVNRADTGLNYNPVNMPEIIEDIPSDEHSLEEDDNKSVRHGGHRR